MDRISLAGVLKDVLEGVLYAGERPDGGGCDPVSNADDGLLADASASGDLARALPAELISENREGIFHAQDCSTDLPSVSTPSDVRDAPDLRFVLGFPAMKSEARRVISDFLRQEIGDGSLRA